MKRFSTELKEGSFRVAIFGSARIKRNDPTYKLVYTLAKMIGKEGMDIVTGGGSGLMTAANAGHNMGDKMKRADSVGLPLATERTKKPNPHLEVKKEFKYFSDRLDTFMILSNVVVVTPGGIGTLLELYYTWQLLQVKQICNTPIILLGDMWVDLIGWMKKNQLKRHLVSKKDFEFVFLAKNASEAFKIIVNLHEKWKNNELTCSNIKRYKLKEYKKKT